MHTVVELILERCSIFRFPFNISDLDICPVFRWALSGEGVWRVAEKVIQHQLRALGRLPWSRMGNGCSVVKRFWLHLRSLFNDGDLEEKLSYFP